MVRQFSKSWQVCLCRNYDFFTTCKYRFLHAKNFSRKQGKNHKNTFLRFIFENWWNCHVLLPHTLFHAITFFPKLKNWQTYCWKPDIWSTVYTCLILNCFSLIKFMSKFYKTICRVQVKRTGTGSRGQGDLYYYKRTRTGLWNWLGKGKRNWLAWNCVCAEIPLKEIGRVRWDRGLHVEKSGGELAKVSE